MLDLLKSAWDRAVSEGGVVQGAPILFAMAAVFLAALASLSIWLAMDWRYSGIIANRDATIGARDSQIGLLTAQVKDLESRVEQLKASVPEPPKNPDAIIQLGKEVGVAVGAQSDLGNGRYYFRAIKANGDYNQKSIFSYRNYRLKIINFSSSGFTNFAGNENRQVTDVVCEVVE